MEIKEYNFTTKKEERKSEWMNERNEKKKIKKERKRAVNIKNKNKNFDLHRYNRFVFPIIHENIE